MALTELWKSSPQEIEQKLIQQVISFAGDGKLRDGSIACKELRAFLELVPPSFLVRYANECLTEKFECSGLALQDVINEVGRRLGFQVDGGRYRGVHGEIGFDGLWNSSDGTALVVEVKTTDAYRIDLNTVAEYRKLLIAEKRIQESGSSILIVVGRSDTGDLEAQVRGSRHAWDIRLISVDFLIRLMLLKTNDLEDPSLVEKIRRVLTPQEFTKVDAIIDLVFSATEDVKHGQENIDEDEDEAEEEEESGVAKKPKFTPSDFRDECAARVQSHLKQPLVKRSFAVYASPDESVIAICINSREYKKTNNRAGYWFAFHPHQRDLFSGRKEAYVALGCGSPSEVLLIPADEFAGWLERCNTTTRDDRSYWHIKVSKANGEYRLRTRKGTEPVKLTKYLLP